MIEDNSEYQHYTVVMSWRSYDTIPQMVPVSLSVKTGLLYVDVDYFDFVERLVRL